MYPAFLTNHKRLGNNMTTYIDSIAPYHYPGGGGFSIIQFSLNGLYELFKKGQNIWTKSNCTLPLIRYTHCNLKLYRSEKYDYICTIQRCYPMCCNDLMYMSTQPFVMMMTKHSIFVSCRQNSAKKKPFKKVTVKAPAQMTTQWHFQTDLAKTGLILLKFAACSLDRIYTGATASSTTIGLTSLTTRTFQYHNWKKPPVTTGYKPQDKLYFWGSLQPPHDPNEEITKNLIYLGNTGPLTEGTTIDNSSKVDQYVTNKTLWGNIFHPNYLSGNNQVYVSAQSPTELKDKLKQYINDKIKSWGGTQYITPRTLPLLTQCRYNPLADQGIGNKIFLISNTSDVEVWHEPKNIKLMRQDFPLWILAWGWLDWQKKLNEVNRIDTEYMTVIQTKYIEPYMEYYLFLDESMLLEKPLSPYETPLTQSDWENFFPKNNFQVESINELCSCGPGTIKLQRDNSAEAHFFYNFNFKLGGCPAPMETICDPIKQPKYPVPSNQLQTPSLQSPETPLETFLYSFDERRGLLTEPAAKRIRKDYETAKIMFPTTGTTSMDVQPPIEEISIETTESSEEEEEETSVQQRLLHLRKKQLKLRKRILKLLTTPTSE